MLFKQLISWIKKNGFTVLLFVFVIVMLVSPSAKSWVLEQLVSAGLFKAEINKKGVNNNLPEQTDFKFTNSQGVTKTVASLKGKVVFINFWASWCPPCRAEMPSLNKLYQEFQHDDRIVFIFINEDDDANNGIQYLSGNHFNIPFYQRSGYVPTGIFSGKLPTTVVLDKQGNIVMKHEGMARYNTDAFIRQLRELL